MSQGAPDSPDRETRAERIIAQYLLGEEEGYQAALASQEHADKMLTWAIGLMGAGIFSGHALLGHSTPYLRLGVFSPWIFGILAALAGRLVGHELRGKESPWKFEKVIQIRALLLEEDTWASMPKLLAIVQNKGNLKERREQSERLGVWLNRLYYATHILFAVGIIAVLGAAAVASK